MKAAVVPSFGAPLEEVNDCIADVLAGQVPARLVFTF